MKSTNDQNYITLHIDIKKTYKRGPWLPPRHWTVRWSIQPGPVMVVAVARPLHDACSPGFTDVAGLPRGDRPEATASDGRDDTAPAPHATQRSGHKWFCPTRQAGPCYSTAAVGWGLAAFPTRFLASSFFSGSRAVRRPPPSVTVSHPTAAGWPPPRDSQSHMRSLISHHTNRQPPLPYAAMFPRYSTKSRSPQVWYVMISMPTNHLTEWFIC
jgi:hypothetical protein